MRLLCADDDDDICSILRLALGLDAALKPHIVRSGDAALAYAAAHPVDAILLDAMMPGIDGYETCRLLKANTATAHIPVVFLTAKTGQAEQQRARAVGAVGCLTKPFDPLTLAKELKGILARSPIGNS
jgi:CheY-like chemotaxis protein